MPTTQDLDHCSASQTVLAWYLDRSEGAQVVVDGEGSIVSANRTALELLAGEHREALQRELTRLPDGKGEAGVRVVERFPGADCVLCEISATPPQDE
jgi:hypothetical protein